MIITKLPSEVFQDIGYYLTKTDIATCQTVCSIWHNKWSAFAYDTVYIHGQHQFDTFFNQTLKSTGYKIRKLVINNGYLEPAVLGQLALLCPHLQEFKFDGVTLSQEAKREPAYYQIRRNRESIEKVKHCFMTWKYMRQIQEYNGITVTHALLSHVTNLTSISVQFNNSNDRTNSKASFIASLVNAPLLDFLSLQKIYLSANELEMIHVNCPSLYSLHLINTALLPMSDIDIFPASALYEFRFVEGIFTDDGWLDYISKKYINVKKLEIGSSCFAADTEPYQIANKLTKLESLKLSSFTLDNQFFQILDQRGIILSELALKSTMLPALVQSQQRHCISSLTIHGWPMLETLYYCTNLISLHLSMTNGTLYFDDILKQAPKLVSLTVTDAKLLVSMVLDNRSFVLHSLTLENVLFENDGVCAIIRSMCPLFNSLSLTSTMPTGQLQIYLPQHRIKTLILDRVRVSSKCNARLGTSRFKITTNEVAWYDLVGYECCSFDSVLAERMRARKFTVTRNDDYHLEQSVHVGVTCKEIRSMYLTGLKVL